jgi:FkbM family methyltransferase
MIQEKIECIIDIGSNNGKFIEISKKNFPYKKIYAFEPLDECMVNLKRKFGEDSNISLFQIALGDREGEIDFYKNSHLDSSSVLKTSEYHDEVFAFSKELSKSTVKVSSLDNVLKGKNVDHALIKIDVQGYEDRVLRGSRRILKSASVVLTEVAFVELYKNQANFNDVYSVMNLNGFYFGGMIDIIKNPEVGEIISGDALFIKR